MGLNQTFQPLELDDLLATCRDYKERGYRLTQLHPILKEDGTITLIYTFVKDDEMINFKITGIKKGETVVPSVTSLYLACFVYENEAHDLFGVNVEGNLLDFQGAFYSFGEGVEAPMTVISPEQLAAREKAARIAKAKAAKEAKAARAAAGEKVEEDPAAEKAAMDEKIAGLDPEKAAKVKAALAAKAAKEAAAKAAAETNDKEGE